MKTTVETVDPTTVELTVEVEPERVKRAFDAAAKELSKQVQLKGFRPGKAPRRLIEQRFGAGAIAQQAMPDALNEFYAEAMEQFERVPVAMPDIDEETLVFSEEEGCRFTATVPVRPEFDAPEHEGIDVQFPEWDVDDDAIDAELAQLRDRYAEVDEVDRAAGEGDFVTIDLVFSVDGEEQTDQAVEDALYEVGTGGVTPALDRELIGVSAGDVVEYEDDLPDEYPELGGSAASFTVTVKDVRAKTLPALDDDFALTASEYDTLDELRDSIRERLLRRSVSEAQHGARGRVLEAYLARIDVPLPEAMVDNETQNRVHQVEHQAESYGLEADQVFEMQGTTREEFTAQAREQAVGSVKAQLVLDQLAERLELEVTDQDVNDEIVRHATSNGMDPNQIAQMIQQQGSIGAMVGDILRRKAIDAIMDAATLDGGPDDSVLIELGLMPDPDAEVPAEAEGRVAEALAQGEFDPAVVEQAMAAAASDTEDGADEDASDDAESSDSSDDSSDDESADDDTADDESAADEEE